jgi:hypothetical protein
MSNYPAMAGAKAAGQWFGLIVMLGVALTIECGTGWAAGFSPRMVPAHQPDTYSLKTFAQLEAWRELSGNAKIPKVFEYLTGRRTGIYPMGVPARAGSEVFESSGKIAFGQNLVKDLTASFVDARVGNLRVKEPSPEITGRAGPVPDVRDDIDGRPRGIRPEHRRAPGRSVCAGRAGT